MKIAIGCDHAGYPLKVAVKDKLLKEGFEVVDFGTDSVESVDYPSYGKAVGKAVAEGEAQRCERTRDGCQNDRTGLGI